MARLVVSIVLCSMVLMSVQAHPGRKILQLSQQVTGRAQVAQAETSAKINAAIDNNMHVKPSQAPKLATTASVHTTPTTPTKVTTALATSTKSDQGTASVGVPESNQAATSAAINKAASGKPAKPAPAPAPKVTTAISSAPKSGQGAAQASGTAISAQAATAAAINKAADNAGKKP